MDIIVTQMSNIHSYIMCIKRLDKVEKERKTRRREEKKLLWLVQLITVIPKYMNGKREREKQKNIFYVSPTVNGMHNFDGYDSPRTVRMVLC